MSGFFEPPPSRLPQEPEPGGAPPEDLRERPPHPAVAELVLARSQRGAVFVDCVDAYPEGFVLWIRGRTSVAYKDLTRQGDPSGPDPFGRHWPMVGERRDVQPPQLLRIGVRFADGRIATNIGEHDRPVGGPLLWPLEGGASYRGAETRVHQGYWVSPLPPAGPVSIVCEWPAVGIALAQQEIDAQLILHAAAGVSSAADGPGGRAT